MVLVSKTMADWFKPLILGAERTRMTQTDMTSDRLISIPVLASALF